MRVQGVSMIALKMHSNELGILAGTRSMQRYFELERGISASDHFELVLGA